MLPFSFFISAAAELFFRFFGDEEEAPPPPPPPPPLPPPPPAVLSGDAGLDVCPEDGAAGDAIFQEIMEIMFRECAR
jgi:hypothetical protein